MTSGVGGSTKKFAFGASYQLGYTVGNLIGPQTYRAADAPHYYVSIPSRLVDCTCTDVTINRQIHHVSFPDIRADSLGEHGSHSAHVE
jgi:hypothetical protein